MLNFECNKKKNITGNDEHGSQDARESDSTLSSPGSQGNDEFGVTKDPSAEATSSGFVVKESAKEISDVEIGTDDKNNVVEKPPTSSNENSTETSSINVALQDPCVKEIAPVVDSVSKVVISETSEHAETSTHSHLVKQKSDEKKECQSLEKDNGKVDTLLESADGTSREVETVRESEAPVSSEEKVASLLFFLHRVHVNLLSFQLAEESHVTFAASFVAWSTSRPNFLVKLLRFV